MDLLDKMNEAINYIEDNLLTDIDYEKVSMKAGTSSYNFQRMFSFITDTSLAEYIRHRRLTLAAQELQNSDTSILDLSYKYGYDSQVSFGRAFKALHGINPFEAKKSGSSLKAYPRISFQISIKGDKQMTYRIETKPAFDIFGIEANCCFCNNGLKPSDLWKQCHKDGSYERLYEDAKSIPDFLNSDLCRIHAVENYAPNEDKDTFKYMLFSFKSKDSKTDGYKNIHIESQTYAVFSSEKFRWDSDFNKVLKDLQKQFYSEWLGASDYVKSDGPNFEIYGGTSELGYLELWFPITKNKK